jgi:hypothetical protein
MLQTLESHAASNFHVLWTSDESQMFCDYRHKPLWAASWEQVDELGWPTHCRRKTTVTGFFNDTGEYFMNILPRSSSMDTKCFAEELVGGLEHVCYPEGRDPYERKIAFHFNSAPMHNTRTVMEQLGHSGSKRMEHPTYSPDLSPCDFFHSHYMKEQLKGRSFAEEEELASALSELMSKSPPDMILRVFADWNRRLWLCLLMKREYVWQAFNLLCFLTGLDKLPRSFRALNAHPGRLASVA